MSLEAPAPKLLLLICNPLRAGGKGIRGINGLTVTTTIISSGCLRQAAHTGTGLSPDKHGPAPPGAHRELRTRGNATEIGTEHGHGLRARAPHIPHLTPHTCGHGQTRPGPWRSAQPRDRRAHKNPARPRVFRTHNSVRVPPVCN